MSKLIIYEDESIIDDCPGGAVCRYGASGSDCSGEQGPVYGDDGDEAGRGLTGEVDYEALEWTVAPGCTFFDRLSLRIPVELDVAMFPKAQPQRTYSMTGTLGLNLGYDLLGSERYLLELNLSGGSTYLRTSANYAYADLSLKFGANIGRAVPYQLKRYAALRMSSGVLKGLLGLRYFSRNL